MLPRKNRLKKKKDFDLVFEKGKSFYNDFLFLKVADNGFKESRFGFVVSQKVSKKAVLRNKIKRTLRAEASKLLPRIVPGKDLILVVKPGTEVNILKKKLENLFKKAKVLNG